MKIKETKQNNLGYTSHDYDGTVNQECPGYGHGDGIRHSKPEDHATYYNLAKDLYIKYPNATKILELGCGAGNLSAHYRGLNPNVLYVTMDINAVSPTLGLIDPESHIIAFTDRPFDIIDREGNSIKFDLILSFEHFEHIPEERVPQLLSNIKNHSHANTSIVATAASFSSVIHPTAWTKEKWAGVLDENGLTLIDDNILHAINTPCNFNLSNTSELIFKLK
jgi:2-polyprenyl-3-methyl-5-hydroxy-6-metoxy-1,4-benzoquinol methylase